MKESYIKHFIGLDNKQADKKDYISFLKSVGYENDMAETLYLDWMGL